MLADRAVGVPPSPAAAKIRRCRHGAHVFERASGANLLLEEISFLPDQWHRAPRYVSFAVTNACELRCPFCYAPKTPGRLDSSEILRWAEELDTAGALGVGFGGGEPTAHPDFFNLCHQVSRRTRLAVSFTTHGHRIDSNAADRLRGHVHFIRVSVDGTGTTYEGLRGRSFAALEKRIDHIASIAPFGINTVVSSETLASLDALADFATRAGAAELLLLPERPTSGRPGLDLEGNAQLRQWIATARSPLRLSIAHGAAVDLPLADPFGAEPALEAHAHVDAHGVLRTDAYATDGVPIAGSILEALEILNARSER